jgi:AbrB family looped-hinge helix DNA binding protein
MSRYQPPELLAAPQTELGSIHQWCNTFSMDITTVSPKFQVVIPKRVREQFGLSPGQTLQVIALPGRIELVPSQPPAALRGFLQGKNTFQREGDRL